MAPPGALSGIDDEAFTKLWMRRDIRLATAAKRLGVTHQALTWKAKSLGLPSRKDNRTTAKKCSDEEFRRAWEAGVNTRDMAVMLGYSGTSAVYQRYRMMGLEPRPRGYRTITMAQYREIEVARRWRTECERKQR